MSRLDDMEARIAALESAMGADLAARILTIEETLGLTAEAWAPITVRATSADMRECTRCGQTQNINNLTCAQAKCPLK